MSRSIGKVEWYWRRLGLSLAVAMFAAACADGSTMPVGAPVVARIVVAPAALTMVEGQDLTANATALDASGTPVAIGAIGWSSSDTSVVRIDSTGRLSAIAAGIAEIRAEAAGFIGTAEVTVSPAPVAGVALSLAALSLEQGASQVVTVILTDAAGRVLSGRPVAWGSGNAAVATVSDSGRITAIAAGRASISASAEGRVATLEVTVRPVAVASVAVTPGAMLLEIGESRQMHAEPRDAQGAALADRAVQWSVDNGNATISPSGLLTAVRGGYVTVFATSEGVVGAVGGTIVAGESYSHDLAYHRVGNNGDSELFILTLGDGSAPLRINAGSVSRQATASPTGRRLAFAVSMTVMPTNEWQHDIYAVDRTGLNIRHLTTDGGREDQPAWSPAGGRIAYVAVTADARSDIWVMNEDGTGQVNLTGDMPPQGVRSSPAWSWDGARLAFAQLENGPAGTTTTIWTMRADGSDKRQVTSTLTGFDATPTWSPDGATLAFRRYYSGDADITVVSLATGALRRIAMPGQQSSPAWSPDGSLIAFVQNAGPVQNIFTIRPDGQRVRLRTVDPAWGGGLSPAWVRRE